MVSSTSQHPSDIVGVQTPFKVKAKYGWSGQTKGDLGFIEGDIMEVTRVTGDWFYGKLLRNKKCSGYFPNNFVIMLEQRVNSNLNSSVNMDNNETFLNSRELQEQKVSIPPIPSRSTYESSGRSSMRLKSTRELKSLNTQSSGTPSTSPQSSPIFNSPTYSTSSSSPVRNSRGVSKASGGVDTFYEQYQHQSSPDLSSKVKFSNGASRKSTHSNWKRYSNLEHNTLPPLPPLPSVSANSNSRRSPQKPTKSYSSNDVCISRLSHSNKHHNNAQNDLHNSQEDFHSRPLNGTTRFSIFEHNNNSNSFSNSRYLDTSTTDSENSFALMSDFSATSAGSFARHRFAQSFTDSLQRSHTAPLSSANDIELLSGSSSNGSDNKKSLTNSNNGQMGNLLRKILPRSTANNSNSSLPKLPSLQDLNLNSPNSNLDTKDWITVKSHVNRSRTLTKYEKHPRYMRALEDDRDLVLHPQDSIYSGLNTNEVKIDAVPGGVDILLTELNRDYIDHMTWKRCVKDGKLKLDTWAQTTFSARYGTTIEKLRGLFIFCTEMYDLIDDNGHSNFAYEPTNLDEVLHKKFCTPYQLTWLFKRLANSLGITCEIVIGFLKTPSADNYEFKYNHCWIRVLVNKEWRFIDVILGNVTNPIHEFINNQKRKNADNSYFLVEPLKFIYTHIPPREFEQHIVPSIDQLSALYLPLVFPSFFDNELKLHNYSTALSNLEDSEIFECSLEIPNDIEVFASIVATPDHPKTTDEMMYSQMELTLTQIKKHRQDSGRRIALIKAVLPPGSSSGSLYIHSGLKGKQRSIANVHPLSMLIPLTHKGSEMRFEFVVRIPSENVLNVEMYVKEPQNRYLFKNNEYNFEVIQNPFDGIIYNEDNGHHQNNQTRDRRQLLAIKSPSGKISELKKHNKNTSYGTSSATLKVKEVGIWKGLVKSDSGIGWCEFAEWLCSE